MLQIFKSKWILPANEKVIENGAILVEDSRIIDVITENQENYSDIEVIDYKNAVITPGFINLHTHLQYTDLGEIQPQTSFTDWLIELIKQYSKWSINQKINSLKNGIKELLLSGTTCIAQLSKEDELFEVLNNSDLRVYLFLETFSNNEETSNIEFKKLKEKINVIEQNKSESLNVGISPHSIYNIHPVLWHEVTEFALENNYLVHTHLAESKDEIEWLEKGSSNIDLIHKFAGWGKIAPLYTNINPVEYLKKLNILRLLDKNLILAHLNYASNEAFEELINYNTNIVHCPRSNIFLHNKTLDIKKLINLHYPLDRIGIGTDSKFSNSDLNIINEARFIKNRTGLDLLKLLDMLTINAAKILQLDSKIGSLETGKEADFLVFKLNDNEAYPDFIEKETPDNVFIKGKPIVLNKLIL